VTSFNELSISQFPSIDSCRRLVINSFDLINTIDFLPSPRDDSFDLFNSIDFYRRLVTSLNELPLSHFPSIDYCHRLVTSSHEPYQSLSTQDSVFDRNGFLPSPSPCSRHDYTFYKSSLPPRLSGSSIKSANDTSSQTTTIGCYYRHRYQSLKTTPYLPDLEVPAKFYPSSSP
jgi:hypothetical protein